MDTTIEDIRAELQRRRGTWVRLSEETGIGYHWLTKFAQGRISNPGYQKVAELKARLLDEGGADAA
ncbi:hypothetical protein [Halorhodospira neutriphila]|uniref:XRE family transcriptional regulator n=1 Tax=Halorhodospira neutriphila TaxID=168379 RepID=A0ABS1E3Z6_9GAMM|nr:hypothetical protein [Halorhodospira neutriphila]MBK1725698.1 hypothetical protein [Halorhodospira neutriphila]